jgi:hypothetical protein
MTGEAGFMQTAFFHVQYRGGEREMRQGARRFFWVATCPLSFATGRQFPKQ